MELYKHKGMVKGWFVGDFIPTVLKTNACEVAHKTYKTGEYSDWHYHKKATEITQIISGKALMKGALVGKGDIIVVKPYESVDFKALTNVSSIVVKIPGIKDDKYQGKYHEINIT